MFIHNIFTELYFVPCWVKGGADPRTIRLARYRKHVDVGLVWRPAKAFDYRVGVDQQSTRDVLR